MAKAFRNPSYNHLGSIDVEIEHPALGWVPFTASPDDISEEGRELYQAVVAAGDIAPYVPPELPQLPSVLYPVDLWSRMTDAEADQVEAAMATQPVRIQNIFKYASSYRSDHELWPLLDTMATSLFGAERAAEILASSA